jgi:hypothetical protein
MRLGKEISFGLRRVSGLRLSWVALCAAMALAAFPCVSAAVHPGNWTGEIGGIGPSVEVQAPHEDFAPFKGSFTVTVTNTGSAPWGDFHFGIFDPIGGQNISNVDFQDASMGGQDPTSSQTGLTWVINNVVVWATIDLYFCSDPVMPGEIATFTVYTANQDQLSFFGVLFYPTPVPPPGACCHPDGSCTLVCVHDCLPPNVWHGEWTTCDANPCPQPTGACCDFLTGACEITTQTACAFTWLGANTACTPETCPVPPPTGACCFLDGHCEILTDVACTAAPEHLFWLAGVTCSTNNPCPQPGACCDAATGNCTYVQQGQCPTGWTWMSGVPCMPNNPCPPPIPTGACCDPLGGCTVTTLAACLSPSVWHPEWTTCEPNFCPPPVPTHSTTWGNIKATYR